MKDGVEIYSRYYPWPERFRLGDPVLVQQVTGLTWPEFTSALEAQETAYDDAQAAGEEAPAPDQVAISGLIAVAFWQGNPAMSRDRARRALERIPLEDIELIEGDEGEADASPPAGSGEADGATPQTTSNASAGSPEAAAETEIPPEST